MHSTPSCDFISGSTFKTSVSISNFLQNFYFPIASELHTAMAVHRSLSCQPCRHGPWLYPHQKAHLPETLHDFVVDEKRNGPWFVDHCVFLQDYRLFFNSFGVLVPKRSGFQNRHLGCVRALFFVCRFSSQD